MIDMRKAFLMLRQDAVDRGLCDLAILYGISYIRLSQEFIDLLIAYERLKQEWDNRP
jgi:molybdate-binding protein